MFTVISQCLKSSLNPEQIPFGRQNLRESTTLSSYFDRYVRALCLIGQSVGQPTQAGVEQVSDGYRVEQRTESEQLSQTEEARELEDGRAKETRRHHVKEVRLEEVKSRESEPRPATVEEMRALLGVEFSGGDGAEIQTSHEITVEEFTRVERRHAKMDSGTGDTQTETTTTESRRTELVSEQPQWKLTAGKSEPPREEAEARTTAPEQLMSLPIVSTEAQASVDVSLPQATAEVAAPAVTVSAQEPAKPSKSKGGGIFGKFKLRSKGKGADEVHDIEAEAAASAEKKADVAGAESEEPMDVSAEVPSGPSTEWTSEHHKVKHKRHVIEEVVLEDSDKFYEEVYKRPRLFIRGKKKEDKENVEPVVERRRSTGEVVVPAFQAPQAASAPSGSSEELVKFVVEYDIAASKLDETVPEGKKRWTMPIFTTGKRDEGPDAGGETTAEKKRKAGDKQEEVVVEDEGLYTDTSLERKGFRFRKKKADQPTEQESETVTFIVHGEQPGAYVKVEPRMEVEEGGDVSTDAKTGLHGSIEFPKFKLFERKQKTSSSEDGETPSPKTGGRKWIPNIHLRPKYAKFGKLSAKGDSVNYHSTFAALHKDTSPQEIRWPRLKVHFGGKYVMTPEVSTDEGKVETETYVIEHIEQLPCETDPDKMDTDVRYPNLRFILNNKPVSDSHEGEDYVIYKVDHPVDTGVSADDKSRDRLQWPDLKLICTTPHPGEMEVEGQETEVPTPEYIVRQILPVSNVTAGADSPVDVRVQLHFGSIGDASEEQKITYIVEHPSRPASLVDGQSGSMFESPKFKARFGTWPGRHGGSVSSALLTRIDELPGEGHTDSGVIWPKLNFHFDGKPAKDGSQITPDKEVISYVVDQQLPEASVPGGDVQWRKVGLDFNSKTATLIDPKDDGEKTLTYTAELAGDGDTKAIQRQRWPKFNIHFDTKPSQRHGEESGPVSYTFAQPIEVSLPKADGKGGIHLPKFDMHIKSKLPKRKASDSSQEPETVTYIVEEATPETEGKGLRVVWPKVDFRLRKRTYAQEKEPEVEPEVVTYIVEQPLSAENNAADSKTRFRIEWPKFNLQFGSKQMKPEDIPTETEVTYVVQEIVPEPSADESKPQVHWPKLKIRFGTKSDDEHPRVDGIDETVTYVVEQPSPDISGKTGRGIHLPKLRIGGKPDAEEQTVTYVVELPTTSDSSSDRQRHFQLKLPKLNVHFGLKKVKHGEGNGDASGEIVTYVVEQIVPVQSESEHRGPKLRWQLGRKKKHDADDTALDETVTYIVEAPEPTEEEKSGFDISMPKPKFDLTFGKKTKKREDEMDTDSDKVPYVLEQEMHVKTKLQIEWPRFRHPHFKGKVEGDDGAAYVVEEIAPLPTEQSDDGSTTGGIRWPKLSVRFRSKTPSALGDRETNTVTYIVEQPSDSGELGWPKFNLHYGGKAGKKKGSTTEAVGYVPELPKETPTDSDEGKRKVGLRWPKLNVNFTLKSVEPDTTEEDGRCVKVTYAAHQIVPVPHESDEKKAGGGIEWPKFFWQFGGKPPGDVDAEHEGEEKVTYIVEAPMPSEEAKGGSFGISVPKPKIDFTFRKKTKKHEDEMETESDTAPYILEEKLPDDSGSTDLKTRLQIVWPKFKFPRFKGKAAAEGDESVTYVVEEVAPVPTEDSHDGSATGGIRWPKLNVRFGSKTPGVETEGETNTVTYVVEQPSAEVSESGGFQWPKFNLHLRRKAGEKPVETPESVTYVVEPVSYTHLTLPTILRV